MTIWTPSRDWLDRHRTADLVYRVRVRVSSPAVLDAVWARLAGRGRFDEEGAFLDGGAVLVRVGDSEVDAVSGGEDALDSLEWCVNRTLGEALEPDERERVIVVAEERALILD